MSPMPVDPYKTLGVGPGISDKELRAAYRRLVQRHHPDHNGGSAEAARKFEEIQEAYARITDLRKGGSGATGQSNPRAAGADAGDFDARIADLERELKEAQRQREEGLRAAREAAANAASESDRPGRPSDEELGYVHTDDSFSKIIADAREELTDRLSRAREHPAARRAGELIDELEELLPKLNDERRRRR